ncbi:MAG: helix-turn-helix transcriptional regulator [Proteobacteria bacterium]|nr:helix-turn-helix transcriptional regulator [Pseudomonadota bacterium]
MKGSATKVDAHVGQRVRGRRKEMGLSQEKLAKSLGVSFQQVQKYEIGINRVSAGRLWDIADSLEVDIGYFFEGIAKGLGRSRKINVKAKPRAKVKTKAKAKTKTTRKAPARRKTRRKR